MYSLMQGFPQPVRIDLVAPMMAHLHLSRCLAMSSSASPFFKVVISRKRIFKNQPPPELLTPKLEQLLMIK